MDFFISDTHFGHDNILGYDMRPFSDTKEMDAELIRGWNETVTDGDDVYILGDFVWTKDKNHAAEIAASLHGRKHLIIGNHDQVFTKNKKFFIDSENLIEEMVEYKELAIPNRPEKIVLCHYPMPFYKNIIHGWYHFYGHVHCTPEWMTCEELRRKTTRYYCALMNDSDFNTRMINVGCMMEYMKYAPKSFAAIDHHLSLLKPKPQTPIGKES